MDYDISGWMYKEGQLVKSWKKRWFIIESNFLTYFVDETKNVCKGHFELCPDLTVIEYPRELAAMQAGLFRKPRPFMFALKTFKRVLFLSTETSGDKEKWVNFFHKFISDSKDPKKVMRTSMREDYKTRKDNPNAVYIYGQEEEDEAVETQDTPFDSTKVVLGKLLGEGSFGKVFLASYGEEELAVKVLQPQAISSELDKEHLLREVDLMNRFRSPYIVLFRGAYIYENSLAIAMEFCEMGSLQRLIETTRISAAMTVKYALDTAKGMSFLHQNQILHRDLKPDNLLIFSVFPDAPVSVKITDFGTGRYIDRSASSCITKHVGTPIYMSPEMLRGEQYSFPSDVYSFAVSLWELWTQSYAYCDINSELDLLRFLETRRLPIPEDCLYAEVINGSWKSDPNERLNFPQIVKMLRETVVVSQAK